ncbi:unnamed protein product, partial [Notodromas monacha]
VNQGQSQVSDQLQIPVNFLYDWIDYHRLPTGAICYQVLGNESHSILFGDMKNVGGFKKRVRNSPENKQKHSEQEFTPKRREFIPREGIWAQLSAATAKFGSLRPMITSVAVFQFIAAQLEDDPHDKEVAILAKAFSSWRPFVASFLALTLMTIGAYPVVGILEIIGSNAISQAAAGVLYTLVIYLPSLEQWHLEHPGNPHDLANLRSYASLVLRTLPVAFFSIITLGYNLFHCILNMNAELNRFADCRFQGDFWNRSSFRKSFAVWNYPVHDWLYEYVYTPIYQCPWGKSRQVAGILALLFSYLFHELLVNLARRSWGWTFVPFYFGAALQQLVVDQMFEDKEWKKDLRSMLYILNMVIGASVFASHLYINDALNGPIETWDDWTTERPLSEEFPQQDKRISERISKGGDKSSSSSSSLATLEDENCACSCGVCYTKPEWRPPAQPNCTTFCIYRVKHYEPCFSGDICAPLDFVPVYDYYQIQIPSKVRGWNPQLMNGRLLTSTTTTEEPLLREADNCEFLELLNDAKIQDTIKIMDNPAFEPGDIPPNVHQVSPPPSQPLDALEEEEPPVLEVEQVEPGQGQNKVVHPMKEDVPPVKKLEDENVGQEVAAIQTLGVAKKDSKPLPGFEEVPIDELPSKQAVTETDKAQQQLVKPQDMDTLCGFGNWHPDWLQKLATPWGFMAVFATALLLQGVYFTYFVAGEDALEGMFTIFMAFFVCGLGISVVQPLGLSYYDDNVKSTHAPLYHGTLSAARVLGPFFGYGLGALCLRLYVNPWDPPPGVTLEDPRWLGAWWLGYLILGSLMIVIGGCLFIFPRKLPTRPSKKIKVPVEEPEKPEPVKNGGNSTLENKGKPHFESEAAEEDILSGALDPGPTELPALKGEKYSCGTEKTCNQPGVAGVLVMVIGMVGAGFFIKKFRPSARTVTGYHILVTAFNIVGMFGAIGIGCSGLNLFGTTDSTSGQMQMHAPCNAHCSCSTAEYNVVCMEPTNVHFYNPCFGGCTGQQVIRKLSPDGSFVNKTVYTGCTCGQASMNFSTSLPINATSDLTAVVQGYCSSATCSNFVSYLVLIGIIKTVTSTSRVGGLMITIRSVEKRDKSLAVGFSLVMFAILAFIPTPILYGAIIDSTCLIWRETKCGTKGNCAFYDANKFRVALHATPAGRPSVGPKEIVPSMMPTSSEWLYMPLQQVTTTGKGRKTFRTTPFFEKTWTCMETKTNQPKSWKKSQKKNSARLLTSNCSVLFFKVFSILKYSQVDQPPHHLLEQKFQGEFVQHEGESIHHPDHKDEDTLCGLGNWRPKVDVFKRSGTSKYRRMTECYITGVVMAGNEISEIVFAIFITYFGGKGHRPHWVSWGIWCTIIACLMMASPQLFETEQESPLYRLPNTTCSRRKYPATSPLKMCLAQTNSALPPVCHSEGHGSIRGMFMMFASFFVSGLGVSVIQPLGLSYYDDNVPPAQAPLFHAEDRRRAQDPGKRPMYDPRHTESKMQKGPPLGPP